MYKIEKGVPIVKDDIYNKRTVYPFNTMKVSDSFFVPMKSSDMTKWQLKKNSIYSAIRARKFKNRKFISRFVNGGVRVWRTE